MNPFINVVDRKIFKWGKDIRTLRYIGHLVKKYNENCVTDILTEQTYTQYQT